MPHNRKERRAQAQAGLKSSTNRTNVEIPLSHPSRTPPSHKTLIEIAEERQLVNPGSKDGPVDPRSITMTTINPDGTLSNSLDPAIFEDLDATPYLDIFLYTLTLILLHFTLTLLVHHQYASKPPFLSPLFLSSTVFSLKPVLFFVLVLTLHPRSSHLVTQVLFAVISIVSGAWVVYATNDEPYLAIMKKAPALGTLWIWAIVEMKWEWAVACLSVVAGWGWWHGYTIA